MSRFGWVLCTALLLCSAGCAAGNRYSYRSAEPQLSLSGAGTLAIGVHDQRTYITSGDKRPTFVGLQRGGFYNPFDVTTEGGKPLAVDISDVLVRALQRVGFAPLSVPINHSQSAGSALDTLRTSGVDRILLVTLREWKSDTSDHTTLIYDIRLEVFDRKGEALASNAIKGEYELGGSWNPTAHAKKAVPEALERHLEELFQNPAVSHALE